MAASTKPAISKRRLCNSSSSSLKCINGFSLLWRRHFRPPPPSHQLESPKPPGYIVFRFLLGRTFEDYLGSVELDQLTQKKKSRVLGNAGGLLHAVSHDDLRALVAQAEHQILNLRCRNR